MEDIRARARAIKLAVFDIDGVFTDGRLYIDTDGRETKAFNVRDGYGIKRLMAAGVEVAIISGRKSAAVNKRMDELGVRHVFQGSEDKLPILDRLMSELGVGAEETAYVGDDVPDLPAMNVVGLAIGVADAHAEVHRQAHWITAHPGGRGAVRDACDFILASREPG